MEVKINKEIRDYTEAIFFGLSLRQFIFFRISLRDCRWALFFASPIHEYGNSELDLCTGSCPMCSVRVCKISWNDSGAVYLGMDKIRNPDAEKTGVPVRKSLF